MAVAIGFGWVSSC